MMKKFFFSIFLILLFIGCDEEEAVDGNRPPVINRIDISHSLESGMDRYVVDTDATDPDGDNVTYSFETDSNIAILASTSTALINIPQSTGTPPDIIIKVIADDDKGGIATREFNLITGNKAPVILFYGADKYKLSRGETTKLQALVGDDDGGDTYSTTFRRSSIVSVGTLTFNISNQSLPNAMYTASQTSSGNIPIELEAIDTDNNLKASSFLPLEIGTGLIHVDSWDTSPVEPYGLDFSSNGHLFVTSTGSIVMELDTNGNKVNGNGWNVTDPSFAGLRALTVDKRTQNELLFLGSDNGQHEFIIKYSKTGTAQPDNKTTFPGIPHYYFIRPNGTILISNNKVSSYGINILNTNGTIQSWTSAGQLSQPRQISLDPDTNNIYVADRGNGRVRVFDSSGSFIRNITGNNGQFSNPHGVLADRLHNAVFVGDTENDRIQEFAFDGTFKAEFKSSDVNKPRYIIRGPDNRIYVASFIDKEIHIFEYR